MTRLRPHGEETFTKINNLDIFKGKADLHEKIPVSIDMSNDSCLPVKPDDF